jgi:DcmR-like sensory protein
MSCVTHLGHCCVLFETQEERKAAVLALMEEGLNNNEQCVFVAPEASIDDWLFEFQAFGIDVQAERASGALELRSSWENPQMHSLEMARLVWRDIEAGLRDFPAIRYVVDVAVNLDAGITAGQLCHWEATLGSLIEGEAVEVVCLYDASDLHPKVLHSALRTHRSVMLRGRTLPNPHYEATRILENEPWLNESGAGRGDVEDLLESLANLY